MLLKLFAFVAQARAFHRIAVLSTGLSLVCAGIGVAQADDVTQPKFRNGLWRFERTVEYVRRPPNENLVLSKTEATRCVDPNIAMNGIFASLNIGSCRSEKPQLFQNQYFFSNRCDFMGPVSTVITADSELSYTEVNVLASEPLPKRDTVIARRLGDCAGTDRNVEASAVRANRHAKASGGKLP